MAALAKYTRRKDKNNSDRQSKATIDKPKSKQKNTPKLRCIFCCDFLFCVEKLLFQRCAFLIFGFLIALLFSVADYFV